jgi:hypothetical protein
MPEAVGQTLSDPRIVNKYRDLRERHCLWEMTLGLISKTFNIQPEKCVVGMPIGLNTIGDIGFFLFLVVCQ